MTPKIDEFIAREKPATPFLVVDLDLVEQAYWRLVGLSGAVAVYYAVKANPALPVIKRLAAVGTKFDAASRAEVAACLAAGVAPGDISFGNTVKKPADIAYAVANGIDLFAFDCSAELDKLAAAAPGARVMCRIVVENHGSRWPLTRKFGCQPAFAMELLNRARSMGLQPYGLSFHVGSQQYDAGKWCDAIGIAADLFCRARADGLPLTLLNMGGGFAVPYREPQPPPLECVFAAIKAALNEAFDGAPPACMIEPGRAIVAPAGLIRSEVLLVTERYNGGCQRWVYLDIGKYGGLAESEGEAIQYRLACPGRSGATGPAIIAGPTCDGHDVIYEHAPYDLPLSLTSGDVVEIQDAGAYTTTYASVGFNGFAPPDEYYL